MRGSSGLAPRHSWDFRVPQPQTLLSLKDTWEGAGSSPSRAGTPGLSRAPQAPAAAPGEGPVTDTYRTHLVRSHARMLSTVTGPRHTFFSCRWVPR